MPNDARLKLHNLKNVNTVLSMLYDKDGNYRAGFSPDEFYNAILLDTLKYGEENFVHLKYAEPLTIKKGRKTATFRRWAGMTPTLRPLLEGVPPAPDKHAYETLEIGNVWSFGRWSEYTDQVDQSIISEVISERTLQYGELANQIKELYARKIWLSAPSEFYANFKSGFKELGFGDVVTLDDLRFMVARMKRMMVKPIGGKFNYICSPEWIYELIDDPRVKAYMEIEQTTGKLWSTGEPFDLFELNFIPTVLDEFAYPDTEFPGVYEKEDGKEVHRYYVADKKGTEVIYLDVHQDFAYTSGETAKSNTGEKYLPDGTAVDDGVIEWKNPKSFTFTADNVASVTVANGAVTVHPEASATKVVAYKVTRSISNTTGEDVYTYAAVTHTDISGKDWIPLPVVRGILFGDEAMVKLNVEGVSDAPRMIVKPLGSSGVADPLDQRQSVGFRVDGFGLAIKRPEAICVTYGLCRNAALAALAYSTADVIYGEYTLMHNETVSTDVNYIDTTNNVQVMNVDGVNSTRVFVKFSAATNYSEGTMIEYKGNYYVFLKGHKGAFVHQAQDAVGAAAATDHFDKEGNLTALGKTILIKVNPNIVK